MRFISLEVSWFKGVKSAHVDFGPGLNILYGPNDLGKSSLATAIRAALLLPTGSSEADAFQPWFSGEKPTVTLVFTDDEGRFWKVKKAFGGAAGAVLSHSKDGQSWSQDAKAKEVDEKLRTLLPWGIVAPGGKGAPRGLPQSFLTNALLGTQDDVEAILTVGLEGDTADSGTVTLTRALSALAQDPLFKQVLDRAQTEVDRFFTETGRRKGGRTSELALAGEAIKKLQLEHDTLARQLADATALEDRARLLREQRAELAAQLVEARARLELTRASFEKAKARQAVAGKVAGIEGELAKLDAHARTLQDGAAGLEGLQHSAEAAQQALTAAQAAREQAASALQLAEEAARQAAAEHGPAQLELAAAKLQSQRATLTEERRRLEALAEKAAAAARAHGELEQTRAIIGRLTKEAAGQAEAHAAALAAQANLTQELELGTGIMRYGRWWEANEQAQKAAKDRSDAAELAAAALARDIEAQQLLVRATATGEEVARRRALLPAADQLAALLRLARDKDLAEAALGGGVHVAVRPRRAIALRAVADDGAPADAAGLQTERLIEAERRVQLSIGDLVDVEITVGGREQRLAVTALRNRWKEEVLPVLERAGAASLADVALLGEAALQLAEAAKDQREKATAAKAAAAALRERAALLEKTTGPSREELEAKEARIGALPREILAGFFTRMGKSWEEQSEKLKKATTAGLEQAQAAVARLEAAQRQTLWTLQDAQGREEAQSRALPALVEGLAGEAPAAAGARIAKALEGNTAAAVALEAAASALGPRSNAYLEAAQQAVVAAQVALEDRARAVRQAELELAGAQARVHATQGELKALRAQLEGLDRPGVEGRLAAARKELAAAGEATATELEVRTAAALVEQLQTAHAEANEEFLKADGALGSQAGPMVKERAQQLADAIASARAREHELDVDAESWRLLRDALRKAENTENLHLGKLLGPPVAARFTELTLGKYGSLALDQKLVMEAVALDGTQAAGQDVLAALSVGTKDQLATLVRLAVASQLKSALLLDDQLVHTDLARLGWFASRLRAVAEQTQILVFTCRPLDYLEPGALPKKDPMREVGQVRAVDLSQVIALSR